MTANYHAGALGDSGVRRLQELIATPPRVRMPCMLIYGVSGAGKSIVVEHHEARGDRRAGPHARMLVAKSPVLAGQHRTYVDQWS
jgi:hypothetical protein